jgi:hypothetical protein
MNFSERRKEEVRRLEVRRTLQSSPSTHSSEWHKGGFSGFGKPRRLLDSPGALFCNGWEGAPQEPTVGVDLLHV